MFLGRRGYTQAHTASDLGPAQTGGLPLILPVATQRQPSLPASPAGFGAAAGGRHAPAPAAYGTHAHTSTPDESTRQPHGNWGAGPFSSAQPPSQPQFPPRWAAGSRVAPPFSQQWGEEAPVSPGTGPGPSPAPELELELRPPAWYARPPAWYARPPAWDARPPAGDARRTVPHDRTGERAPAAPPAASPWTTSTILTVTLLSTIAALLVACVVLLARVLKQRRNHPLQDSFSRAHPPPRPRTRTPPPPPGVRVPVEWLNQPV